jgi:hypothetical protein
VAVPIADALALPALGGEKVSTTTERGLTQMLDRRGSLFNGAVKK